jgi:hypothetical protein
MPTPFSAARLRRSASFRRLTGVGAGTFQGRPWEVGGLEDHLLVMLIYYRCYVTQEFIGFLYGVERSVICRTIKRIEAHAKPLFGIRRDPRLTRDEASALIVDCTEQPVQRPGKEAKQGRHYSGKKKRHTLKTEYIVTEAGRIASVSPSHPGSSHDLTIRREGPALPDEARLMPTALIKATTGIIPRSTSLTRSRKRGN